MKVEEIITRGRLLDDLRAMLYLKLMELHIALSNENFAGVNVDDGQTVDMHTPKLEILSAVKDTLMSLQLLGCGVPLLGAGEKDMPLIVEGGDENPSAS